MSFRATALTVICLVPTILASEVQDGRKNCYNFLTDQARNLSMPLAPESRAMSPKPVTFENGTKKAPPTLRRSPGCGRRLPVSPGVLSNRQISVHDPGFESAFTRHYRIFYPSTYKSRESHPVFFFFHGYGGSETSQNYFHQIGEEHGAITVYMRGASDGHSRNSWNNNNAGEGGDASCTSDIGWPYPVCYSSCERLGQCGRCNCYTCADDHAFVRAVLGEIANDACIDYGRVYAGGMSNGGQAIFTLPESGLPDLFAAVVSFKGLPFEGNFHPTGSLRETAVMSVIGTNDRIMPIDGSPSSCGYVYMSQAASMRALADVHDCGNGDTAYSTPYGASCRTFTGCRHGDGSVVSCSTNDGHGFPNYGYEMAWWWVLQHSR